MNNETLTKCICHKGFSGYSIILAHSNFCVGGDRKVARNPLLHIAANRYNKQKTLNIWIQTIYQLKLTKEF